MVRAVIFAFVAWGSVGFLGTFLLAFVDPDIPAVWKMAIVHGSGVIVGIGLLHYFGGRSGNSEADADLISQQAQIIEKYGDDAASQARLIAVNFKAEGIDDAAVAWMRVAKRIEKDRN